MQVAFNKGVRRANEYLINAAWLEMKQSKFFPMRKGKSNRMQHFRHRVTCCRFRSSANLRGSDWYFGIPLPGNFGNCAQWRDLNLFG
jgi:hypothetical protein